MLLDLCDEMDELAPDALLLNYVNPMAANCWAVDAGDRPPARRPVPQRAGDERDAGRVGWGALRARSTSCARASTTRRSSWSSAAAGRISTRRCGRRSSGRGTGQEPVRVELMQHFGYFVTESSGHASEYAPYFRKSARMIEEELVPRFKNPADHWFDFGRTGGYLRTCMQRLDGTRVARRGSRPAHQAHPRVWLVHHGGDGDGRADEGERQCAEPGAYRRSAGRMLRRGALPGGRWRGAAYGRWCDAPAAPPSTAPTSTCRS